MHPEGQLFSKETASVTLPAEDGLMGVLDNHAPMVVSLGKGQVELEGHPEKYEIEGGFAQVENSVLVILAEKAVPIN